MLHPSANHLVRKYQVQEHRTTVAHARGQGTDPTLTNLSGWCIAQHQSDSMKGLLAATYMLAMLVLGSRFRQENHSKN